MGISGGMAMTQRRLSFAIALVSIVVSFSSPDAATEPGAADIVMLEEEELAKPPPSNVYAKIPGFKFNFDSHPANVKDKDECESVCNSQATCQSYSYAERLNVCEWSTAKMQYDPDFVFSFKPTNGQGYHHFPGLVYRATGWLKSEGKTMQECAGLCDRAAACAAFSYRSRDKLCLLSGHQVGFHQDFNYYEKEGPHKEFAMRPKDWKPIKTPAPAPAQAGTTQPSNAAVVSAAVTAAQAAVAGAAPGAAAAAPAPAEAGEPPSVVAERLQAVKDWAAQKIEQEKQEADLKIKAAQVDNEAALEKQKAADEEQRNDDELSENKAHAQREAERQAENARTKADNMVKKVRLEAKEASVTAELSQAAAEKQEAQTAIEKANKEVETIKEVEKKKNEVARKEILDKAKQKTDEDMQLKLVREKDGKATDVAVKTTVAEKTAQVRKEMSDKTKAAIRSTIERNSKMVDQERARKSTRAITTQDTETQLESLKDHNKALAEQLSTANQKIADALLSESKTKAEMKLAVEQAKAGESAQVASNELESKTTANAEVQRAELARQRSDEQLRKASRVQQDMQMHSMEAAQKSTDTSDQCQAEYKQMQQTAETEEQATAQTASTMPAAEGNALLETKKAEWRTKLETKQNQCIPKKVEFSVKVQPISVASVAAPAPSGPTMVALLSLSEDTPAELSQEQSPDPWALDRPVAKTLPDGTIERQDIDNKQRLRESNAAMSRGMQNIESGAAEQVAYYKFKVAELKSGEVVKDASMSLRKEGGPESTCIVKLTKCDYDPHALTYENRPAILNTVSNGAVFPAADGEVTFPLDSSLITTYLSNEGAKDETVCIELSGGQQNQPVTVDAVNVVLKIEKDPGVTDTTQRRRRTLPPVEMARRRRSELPEARRRRSVQTIKDRAEPIYKRIYERWQPIYEEKMHTKLPYAIAKREKEIETSLKLGQPAIVEQAIQMEMDKRFNKDEFIEQETKQNNLLMKDAVERDVAQRYATEKSALKTTMQTKIRTRITNQENAIVMQEANAYADNKVKTEESGLLESAVQSRVSEEIGAALARAVDNEFPKDYSSALAQVVTPAVEEKTQGWLKDEEEKEIEKRMQKAEEPGGSVDTAMDTAETAALATKAQQTFVTRKADEIASGSELGNNLASSNQATRNGAKAVLENAIKSEGPGLTAAQIATVRADAKKAKVDALKLQITTDVRQEYSDPTKIAAKVTELKGIEEARLKPVVVADIRKNLETDLEGGVRLQLTQKAKAEQATQKDAILKKLHAAFVTQKKSELDPAMNARITQQVTEATDDSPGTKFSVDLQAAEVELKEKIKAEVEGQLRKAYEKITKSKIKTEEEEIKEEIADKIKADKAKELQTTIANEQAKVEPVVTKELEASEMANLKKKVQEETKKEVDKELGPELKQAVKHKYEEGTMSQAMGFVKRHRENAIREEELAKIKKQVADQVAIKLPTETHKLKLKIIEELKKSIFNTLQTEQQDALATSTQGMTASNAAAVELTHNNRLQAQAASQAEAQATVKMEGTNGQAAQLKEQLTLQAENALKEGLEAKVTAAVKAEAEEISQKSLEQKYKDDLDAMELGKTHVPKKKFGERTAPNVIDAASTVEGMAAGTAAQLNAEANAANATIENMDADAVEEINAGAENQTAAIVNASNSSDVIPADENATMTNTSTSNTTSASNASTSSNDTDTDDSSGSGTDEHWSNSLVSDVLALLR